MNFPSVQPDELQRLQPWIRLADQLGGLVAQMGAARIEALGVRYYGALAESRGVDVLAASAAAGVLRPILSSGVSIVNARAAAAPARHRHHRVAQHAGALLHQPGLDQAAHRRGRTVGRRHGVRAEQPAAGFGSRRQRRSAARRDDADRSRTTISPASSARSARSSAATASTSPTSRSAAATPARSASSTWTKTRRRRASSIKPSRRSGRCPPSAQAWIVRLT